MNSGLWTHIPTRVHAMLIGVHGQEVMPLNIMYNIYNVKDCHFLVIFISEHKTTKDLERVSSVT